MLEVGESLVPANIQGSDGHGPAGKTFENAPVELILGKTVRKGGPGHVGELGANEADTHLTGVNPSRDFQVQGFADLRNACDGDPCPRCSAKLTIRHAVEVGHVFKLGTKYSEALGARFLIGDTPNDIAAAHAIGAVSVAVATGRYPAGALKEAGADVVVEDLSDTGCILEILRG